MIKKFYKQTGTINGNFYSDSNFRDFRDCILTYFPIPRHCPCNGAGIG